MFDIPLLSTFHSDSSLSRLIFTENRFPPTSLASPVQATFETVTSSIGTIRGEEEAHERTRFTKRLQARARSAGQADRSGSSRCEGSCGHRGAELTLFRVLRRFFGGAARRDAQLAQEAKTSGEWMSKAPKRRYSRYSCFVPVAQEGGEELSIYLIKPGAELGATT